MCSNIIVRSSNFMCSKKHDNSKQAATASSQSDSHKRSSTDAKSKPEEHQASPEAVDAGGPADYSALPLDQIYDQNWYKTGSELVGDPGHTAAAGKQNDVGMDASAPVNDHDRFYNFNNARYQIDSVAKKAKLARWFAVKFLIVRPTMTI